MHKYLNISHQCWKSMRTRMGFLKEKETVSINMSLIEVIVLMVVRLNELQKDIVNPGTVKKEDPTAYTDSKIAQGVLKLERVEKFIDSVIWANLMIRQKERTLMRTARTKYRWTTWIRAIGLRIIRWTILKFPNKATTEVRLQFGHHFSLNSLTFQVPKPKWTWIKWMGLGNSHWGRTN